MKKSAANSKKSNDVKFYALCKYKNGESVSAIAREIGVCKSTVHYWIKTIQVPEGAKAEDYVPSIASQESVASEKAFTAVVTTAGMNELEITEYCAKNSITRENLTVWRNNCMTANNKGAENDINRLLKIIEEKDRELAESRAESKAKDAVIADNANKIQELERTAAARASLALSAKKAEAFFKRK